MSSATPATLFDAFNARFLEPQNVGSSFVSSPFIERAAGQGHAAILGPRGSGKTTLLKMLTLPALLRWKGEERDEIARQLKYLSVYIPASITWNADYRSFASAKIDDHASNLISVSLFRHSFLLSLINTWVEASHPDVARDPLLSKFSLPIVKDSEPALVRELARLWDLEIRVSSVHGLRSAVGERVRFLQRALVHIAHGSKSLRELIDQAPFIGAHFIDDAISFLDFLSDFYGFDHKVALCFDELEIATHAVSEAVLLAPRSIDQRLLIKFSAAPYVSSATGSLSPTAPTQSNDFELVFMSSFSTREVRGFSEALFNSVCLKHGVESPAHQVLGLSFMDEMSESLAPDDDRQKSGRYAASGGYQRKFESLYSRDVTFRDYTKKKGVVVSDLSVGSEKKRAADVRKIIWPVLVREEFLFSQEMQVNPPKRRIRSKNTISDLYTGASSLFALCEGNPRWILGLLEPMVVEFARSGGEIAVKRSDQKEAVERMTAAYFALLSTIPITADSKNIHSLVDLVDKIGQFFQNSVLGPHFNPDPILGFYVDDRVPPPVRDLIGKGINIGAFITTQDSRDAYHVGQIGGLKVRLANIFAPRFKLPLAGGRFVNLSTILTRSEKFDTSSLLDLFGAT